MEKIQVLPVYKDTTEKIWLPVNCGDSKMEFAYPPIQGYHAAAYQAMAKDPEIRAARGIELAVLPYAAYTNKQSLWEQIKKKFKARFIQSPHRALLLPKGSLPDKNLEGIIIGTNTKQVRTSMSIPSSFDNWKQDGNIFYTPDKQRYFLPIGTFKFGEHTAKSFGQDAFAQIILSPEGAALYAKTAIDNNLKPYLLGLEVEKLKQPDQRVVMLHEGDGSLLLCCWVGDSGFNFTFGVRRSSSEAGAREQ